MATAPGTPPRWRGRPHGTGQRPACRGNTPALAGTTIRTGPDCKDPSEHPRVGGDDLSSGAANGGTTGTPPRWRGRLHRGEPGPDLSRNTPALAGTTLPG